jgi:titin
VAHPVRRVGDVVGARNIISGNGTGGASGVQIWDIGTSNNIVAGNFIGTDVTGTAAIGNQWNGVGIFAGNSGGFGPGVTQNFVSATQLPVSACREFACVVHPWRFRQMGLTQ